MYFYNRFIFTVDIFPNIASKTIFACLLTQTETWKWESVSDSKKC